MFSLEPGAAWAHFWPPPSPCSLLSSSRSSEHPGTQLELKGHLFLSADFGAQCPFPCVGCTLPSCPLPVPPILQNPLGSWLSLGFLPGAEPLTSLPSPPPLQPSVGGELSKHLPPERKAALSYPKLQSHRLPCLTDCCVELQSVRGCMCACVCTHGPACMHVHANLWWGCRAFNPESWPKKLPL